MSDDADEDEDAIADCRKALHASALFVPPEETGAEGRAGEERERDQGGAGRKEQEPPLENS